MNAIKELVADTGANQYVRAAAMRALNMAVLNGMVLREEALPVRWSVVARHQAPLPCARPLVVVAPGCYPPSMTRDEVLSRISIDPNVCFGKPCIRGHRIWVSLVLNWLASGQTVDDVLAEYPQLTREDVLACIAYGAEMSADHYVEIPKASGH